MSSSSSITKRSPCEMMIIIVVIIITIVIIIIIIVSRTIDRPIEHVMDTFVIHSLLHEGVKMRKMKKK